MSKQEWHQQQSEARKAARHEEQRRAQRQDLYEDGGQLIAALRSQFHASHPEF